MRASPNPKVAVTIRIPSEAYRSLQAIAAAENMSIAGAVTTAVEKFIENRDVLEIHKTKYRNYYIRTRKSFGASFFDAVELINNSNGTTLCSVQFVKQDSLREVIEQLETLAESFSDIFKGELHPEP